MPTRQECLDDWAAATTQLVGIPLITRRQAAALSQTSLRTWDSYVSRDTAPQPVGFHPTTGSKMWDRDAVEEWARTRVRYTRRT